MEDVDVLRHLAKMSRSELNYFKGAIEQLIIKIEVEDNKKPPM